MNAPTPEPSMPEPPMGGAPEGGMDMGNENPMGGQSEMPEPPMDEPSMDGAPEGGEENFEGDDKKKEIQKLAGELSELLHTYNEENGEDEELNKYVKGMIEAQTDGEGEDDEEMPEDEGMKGEDDMEEEPMEDTPPQPEEDSQPEAPKMEGRRLTKKQLREEFADMAKKEKDVDNLRLDKKINKNASKNSPFTPPKFN